MKKLRIFCLFAILAVLLGGCLQGSIENPAETQPTESTTIPTTTVPPATSEDTILPSTDEPVSSGNLNQEPWGIQLTQDVLDTLSFTQLAVTSSYSYKYTGESPLINLPYGNVSILLPEGWVEKSVIQWHQTRENRPWYLHIKSTELLYEWIAYEEGIDTSDVDDRLLIKYLESPDYVLLLCGIPHEDTSTMMDERGYLGCDEDFRYYFVVPELWEDWWDMWRYREDMMEALGEDTYNALLNNMVITEEMAREMITITNLVEDGE